VDEFREVAILGQIADPTDSDEEILAKLQAMYEKMREHENDDPMASGSNDMSPEQMALDQANYLLDTAALTGANWSEVRSKLAEVYKSVGRDDMAEFVNPGTSS
jgi:Zn-dependent M16 (insulinase) family peptidase